jgi:hypothetical protein
VALVDCIRTGADPGPGFTPAPTSGSPDAAGRDRFEDWVETIQDSRRSVYASLEPGEG